MCAGIQKRIQKRIADFVSICTDGHTGLAVRAARASGRLPLGEHRAGYSARPLGHGSALSVHSLAHGTHRARRPPSCTGCTAQGPVVQGSAVVHGYSTCVCASSACHCRSRERRSIYMPSADTRPSAHPPHCNPLKIWQL